MRLHGQGIVLSHMKRDKPGSKAKGSQRQPEASMVPPPNLLGSNTLLADDVYLMYWEYQRFEVTNYFSK